MTTPATARLDALSVPYRVLTYDHDSTTRDWGIEAAEALGLDPDAVFKTLVAQLDNGELVVAVVPVSTLLDLKALARAAGAKRAIMATPAAAERSSGYVTGGISPIGQRRPLRTVIDETAELFDEVFVSGGRRGMDLGLAPADLAAAIDGAFAPIAVW